MMTFNPDENFNLIPSFMWTMTYMQSLIGSFVVFRIYVALAIFKQYRDLEAGDNQSLKS